MSGEGLAARSRAEPACHGDVCITCSDVAVEVRVRAAARGPDGRGGHRPGRGTVSVALVSAAAGDTILVHAGEAIAVVREVTRDGEP